MIMKLIMRSPGHSSEGETSREKLNILIAPQNKVIRTNYVETKFDNMPQNS